MSVHLTKCSPSQYKSEIFQNEKMNKTIQLLRPIDGSYKPYEMTNWNRAWQCLFILPISCRLGTNKTIFKMTKWTNRFSCSDQLTDHTNSMKWQTGIGDAHVCPSYQFHADWNRAWQCLFILQIACCFRTNKKIFKMTKWANRFCWSDQMENCTNRTNWQTEIGVGNFHPIEQ